MPRLVVMALLLGGCFTLASPDVARGDAELWEKLKEGGRVALVRHGDAPGGAGDPAGWKLGDCKTQRNLSEKGRAQSRALGKLFRANGISVDKIISSQWCRCMETARLMDLGVVAAEPGFNNAYVLGDRRSELAEAGRTIIANWTGPGTLVVVTHGANILALAGLHPREGEVVVVEPDRTAPSKFRVLGRVPPAP